MTHRRNYLCSTSNSKAVIFTEIVKRNRKIRWKEGRSKRCIPAEVRSSSGRGPFEAVTVAIMISRRNLAVQHVHVCLGKRSTADGGVVDRCRRLEGVVEDRAVATWLARGACRPAQPRIRCKRARPSTTQHIYSISCLENNKIKV